MLVLHGIPINHFRPQGRQLLIDELQRLDTAFGTPSFVAVEWNQEHHRQVVAQRSAFEVMLRSEFASANEDELQILMNSLGYEGDAHLSVWPNSSTLWLDIGREVESEKLELYAYDRIKVLSSFAAANPTTRENDQLLDLLDQQAIARADVRQGSRDLDQREQRWIKLLAKQRSTLVSGDGDWGIIILGGSHLHEKFLLELSAIGYEVRGCIKPLACS